MNVKKFNPSHQKEAATGGYFPQRVCFWSQRVSQLDFVELNPDMLAKAVLDRFDQG
jgi:hypothetical protein